MAAHHTLANDIEQLGRRAAVVAALQDTQPVTAQASPAVQAVTANTCRDYETHPHDSFLGEVPR